MLARVNAASWNGDATPRYGGLMKKHIAVGATLALLVAGIGAGSAAAAPGDRGAQRISLVGPNGSLTCAELKPSDSEAVNDEAVGFVVFNQAGDTVKAQVVIQDGAPKALYRIRLVQADENGAHDCHAINVAVRTNKQGRATANVSESVTGDRAQISIDSWDVRPRPVLRASEAFELR